MRGASGAACTIVEMANSVQSQRFMRKGPRAAVAAVPLARRLGLGSVLGYLLAGVIVGPWGLRLITNVQSILDFSEFGVVLMMFVIGLELEPARLWSLRRGAETDNRG